ncbi:MAG: glycosyltransferase [Anaerolineales bacterium]|nr:glycosyltransferase [Anaerolineales bacterium]
MKNAAIITVNYYSGTLIHTLERTAAQLSEIKVIVVDNSGDFKPILNTTLVVSPGKNLGFGRACNLGAQNTDAPILLFLNPDAEISPQTLEHLLNNCPGPLDRTIWWPSLLDGSGRVSTLKRPGRYGLAFQRIYIQPTGAEAFPVLYASGACLAIGAELFNLVGGYCEDIFLYAEDLDLCLRTRALGAEIFLLPELTVQHAGGRSTSKFSSRFKRLMRSYNGHYLFFRKHDFSPIRAGVNALHLASGLRI